MWNGNDSAMNRHSMLEPDRSRHIHYKSSIIAHNVENSLRVSLAASECPERQHLKQVIYLTGYVVVSLL